MDDLALEALEITNRFCGFMVPGRIMSTPRWRGRPFGPFLCRYPSFGRVDAAMPPFEGGAGTQKDPADQRLRGPSAPL